MPTRLYFDLTSQERWHRREWETRLERLGAGARRTTLAASAADADYVVLPEAPQLSAGGWREHWSGPRGPRPREFVWDSGDFPTGRWPGFYCSLPRPAFHPDRHRSFCYPITYNEQVEAFALQDATFLYGFVGGITSRLRARLVQALTDEMRSAEALVSVQSGPWNQMFDRSGLASKIHYAESLRRCRFFLCPRGNGVGSVRLFETMCAARVPVIISDHFVLPAGIDWSACSVQVRESQVAEIPQRLRELAPAWSQLAENARRAWELHFGDATLLDGMAEELEVMAGCPGTRDLGARWHYFRALAYQLGRRRLIELAGRLRR